MRVGSIAFNCVASLMDTNRAVFAQCKSSSLPAEELETTYCETNVADCAALPCGV
jgi:hypothetical protein